MARAADLPNLRTNLGFFLLERELSSGVLEKLRCPNCNSEKVALIFWGYPNFDRKMEQAVKNKKIVMGGCLVTDHDPKWECTNCNHRWGERDDDYIDSFDYDQGYNLDEVYDQ